MIRKTIAFGSPPVPEFRILYERYAKKMLNISYRIVNNTGDAEDILQECFVTAYKNMAQFDTAASFEAWLKRVVINRSIDHVRKNKIRFNEINEDMDIADDVVFIELEDDDPNPEPEVIKSAIAELPEGYRIVLSLYLFEELTHAEIAALLHISIGTSKSQYSRAKKKLADLLQLKKRQHEKI